MKGCCFHRSQNLGRAILAENEDLSDLTISLLRGNWMDGRVSPGGYINHYLCGAFDGVGWLAIDSSAPEFAPVTYAKLFRCNHFSDLRERLSAFYTGTWTIHTVLDRDSKEYVYLSEGDYITRSPPTPIPVLMEHMTSGQHDAMNSGAHTPRPDWIPRY